MFFVRLSAREKADKYLGSIDMHKTLSQALLVSCCLLGPSLATAQNSPLFGTGGGLDHVGLVTLQLDQTADDYQHKLGFQVSNGGRFPDGVRNQIIWLSNYQYLELLTSSENATDDDGREVYDFAKKHEGAMFFGIETSSAEQSAAFLRKQGFDSVKTQAGAQINEKDPADKSPQWTLVFTPAKPIGTEQVFLTPCFLLQYLAPRSLTKEHLMPEAAHPNGATRIKAVLIATRRISEQVENLQRAGFSPEPSSELTLFSATATAFGSGRGQVCLLDATKAADPVKRFLETFDDGQVLGVIFEVPDLEKTKEALSVPYVSEPHRVWIKPEVAHGLWIGFEQNG
jgi:hypothetical protein